MKQNSNYTGLAVAIAALACAGAQADTITAVVGGGAESTAANYVTLDSQSGGSTASYTYTGAGGNMIVSFTGNGQWEGTAGNNGANNPLESGANNQYFGGPASITTPYGDNTTYLATGTIGNAPPGSATFNFSSAQNYFGLLWGSVDANNTLKFYSGANGTGTLLDTITGSYLQTLNSEVAQTGFGDQYDTWGTAYVNVNTTSGFESIVATSTTFTFEIDNVAYGTASVPDSGTTLGFLGASLACLWGFKRKMAPAKS